jgi:hypothetical protein
MTDAVRRTLVLGLGAGALLAAGGVRAFSFREPSAFAVEEYEANRCGPKSEHRRLIDEAKAAMTEKGISEEEQERLLAALTCPFCGCSVFQSGQGLF